MERNGKALLRIVIVIVVIAVLGFSAACWPLWLARPHYDDPAWSHYQGDR